MARYWHFRLPELVGFEQMEKTSLALPCFIFGTTASDVCSYDFFQLTRLILYSYNSAIFSTTAVSEYYAIIASDDFLHNGTFLLAGEEETLSGRLVFPYTQSLVSDLQAHATSGSLNRLENSDCIREYSAPLNTDYSNLVVVTKSSIQYNNSVLDYYLAGPYAASIPNYATPTWICGNLGQWSQCPWNQLIENAATWNFSTINYSLTQSLSNSYETGVAVVDHCLAQPFSSTSKVELDQST